jgi:hypothetical protein
MLKKHQAERMLVRLPRPQKEWLTRVAEANCTSLNVEVIRSVRERMEGEKAASLSKAKGRATAAAAE